MEHLSQHSARREGKHHRLWFGEFLGIRQDHQNKSFRGLTVFQASLDLIIPQICSAEHTGVSRDWHTIEQATYKLLRAQNEFMKQRPAHFGPCANTSDCMSHQMRQMEPLCTRECFLCTRLQPPSPAEEALPQPPSPAEEAGPRPCLGALWPRCPSNGE